jgi:hypothetical protein
VIALVIGGVLLTLRPLPSENLVTAGSREVVTMGCPSPFQQFQGHSLSIIGSPTPLVEFASSDAYPLRCKSAASDREHVIEGLGVGAVILTALSFWRRRRPVVTIPVNPSLL